MAREIDRNTIQRRWEILTRNAQKTLDETRVSRPLDLLTGSGMSYRTAVQFLTKLEKHGYIKKHKHGGRWLLEIWLKRDELGEDILGSKPSPRPQPGKNNQVAGQEPPAPAMEAVVEKDEAKKNAADDVVVVFDYENLRYSLEDDGAVLDFHELIKSARKYGSVVRSTAFVPVHTFADMQTKLRISGFGIETCPPRKLNGGDTCDQAIEEFVRFCLNHTNIGTFALVSGDGDFIDIVDEIKNNGRKCVLFHYNYSDTSKVLLSRIDDAFNIASVVRPKEKVVQHAISAEPIRKEAASKPVGEHIVDRRDYESKYRKQMESLRDGTTAFDKTDSCWSFLKAIICCLKDVGLASEVPIHRKSFPELKTAVWQEIRRKFSRLGLTKDDDCHEALSALRKLGIIKQMEQGEAPHTYYVLDRNHPLVPDILTL